MIKVKLRRKPISDGRSSLYLDFYPAIPHPDTGKPTRREFLGLYVFNKPKTIVDKDQNKETIGLAENIRAKRQLEVQLGAYGFLSDRQRKTCFVAYFKQQTAKRKGSNRDNWTSALAYLEEFTGGTIKMSELTVKKCNEFREYLSAAPNRRNGDTLSINSALSYFNKFKSALRDAHRDGLLAENLGSKVVSIKPEETSREYLTLEELQAVANTECAMPVMKVAALFSALTGLRFSDIENLTWGEVRHAAAGGYSIQFRQQKTQGVEVLPIPEQANELLGQRGEPNSRVFPNLSYSAYNNQILKQWIKDSGVTKNITFHCFRHTYATLQLTLGTDIYTISKMLGHRELKTTQIYAKIVDQKKRDATDKIKLVF
ncbi:site-specific integrase [Larkinella terrae]|uniref:Tyrosine-type recombinase/integrase n=1 Tax=Larkinella terrae TaxID=2025311 RepID=A0A7K0ED09_9BACT|nr:site-specific integrase [Larkinella terrae]MRS59787.1 tyrosine-type recombinase/integrase [Larkinella terrae]